MTTIIISKSEYSKIVRTQEALEKRVDLLQKMFEKEICEEVRPEYIKKLEKIDASLDRGKGVRFLNASKARKYLRSL